MQVVYPPIHTAMYKLFTEQEADRVRLRSAHLTQQVYSIIVQYHTH